MNCPERGKPAMIRLKLTASGSGIGFHDTCEFIYSHCCLIRSICRSLTSATARLSKIQFTPSAFCNAVKTFWRMAGRSVSSREKAGSIPSACRLRSSSNVAVPNGLLAVHHHQQNCGRNGATFRLKWLRRQLQTFSMSFMIVWPR